MGRPMKRPPGRGRGRPRKVSKIDSEEVDKAEVEEMKNVEEETEMVENAEKKEKTEKNAKTEKNEETERNDEIENNEAEKSEGTGAVAEDENTEKNENSDDQSKKVIRIATIYNITRSPGSDPQRAVDFVRAIEDAQAKQSPASDIRSAITDAITNVHTAIASIKNTIVGTGNSSVETGNSSVDAGNASFDTGNASFDTGNASFDTGNASFDTGNASFDTGNASFDTGNASFNTGNASFNTGNASFNTGNASFNTGNASFNTGNASFNTGNASFNTGNASFNTGNASFKTGNASFNTGNASFNTGNASFDETGNASFETEDMDVKTEHRIADFGTGNILELNFESSDDEYEMSGAQICVPDGIGMDIVKKDVHEERASKSTIGKKKPKENISKSGNSTIPLRVRPSSSLSFGAAFTDYFGDRENAPNPDPLSFLRCIDDRKANIENDDLFRIEIDSEDELYISPLFEEDVDPDYWDDRIPARTDPIKSGLYEDDSSSEEKLPKYVQQWPDAKLKEF